MVFVDSVIWNRIDATRWAEIRVEAAGSTTTVWLEEPETCEEWLHKDTVIPSNGVEQGEDWSEVISTQVAQLLKVPCAETRMCIRAGRRGSLSRNVRPTGQALFEGHTVLFNAGAGGYFPHSEGKPGVDPSRPELKRPGHHLTNIKAALDGVAAPPNFRGPPALTGFDVFAGYMIFDALVANQDRHEQNWAILTSQLVSSTERLAPSYDHASSLGYNLSDTKRKACIDDPDRLRMWANRGTAIRFEHHASRPTLVEHAVNAVEKCTPEGAHWWREQICDLDLEPLRESLQGGAISGMSVAAATFASNLLSLNQGRLRDAICNRA